MAHIFRCFADPETPKGLFRMLWQVVVCAALAAHAAAHYIALRKLQSKIFRKEEEVALLQEERRQERQGRTKAERELRELQLKTHANGDVSIATEEGETRGGPSSALDMRRVSFPLRPIGTLRSCFNTRNGTPRQPLLAPSARATLTLRPELPLEILDGLKQYSHCWVIYVFHENTDLHRLWGPSYAGVKSKIRVPRLQGSRLGVFATRSPHRPCPIGLSVAEIIDIQGSTLILGGADIVDGSPVLDIKPYVPFCDSLPTATAPAWVASAAAEEPLNISVVEVPPAADATLERCWLQNSQKRRSLYRDYAGFRGLVVEVLSRDIRSVTQRVKVPSRERQERGIPSMQADVKECKWRVILDGVNIAYDVEVAGAAGGEKEQTVVVLKSATCML